MTGDRLRFSQFQRDVMKDWLNWIHAPIADVPFEQR
jgi:hypothetical protein